jgi:hypothetical protein
MGRGVRGAHDPLGPPPPPPTIALPATPHRLGFCLPRFGLLIPCPQRAMAFGCRGENPSIRYRTWSLRVWVVIRSVRHRGGFSRPSLACWRLLFIRPHLHARPIVLPCRLVWACPRAWNRTTQQPASCGRGVGLLRATLRSGQPSARRGIKTRSRNPPIAAPPASRLTAPAHPSRNPLLAAPNHGGFLPGGRHAQHTLCPDAAIRLPVSSEYLGTGRSNRPWAPGLLHGSLVRHQRWGFAGCIGVPKPRVFQEIGCQHPERGVRFA